MKVPGSDLIVSIADGGQITYLAASRSCELDCQTNFIQVCAPHGQGGWVHNKPTTTSWSVSADCLVADNAYVAILRNAWKNKTKLSLRWYSTDLKDYQKGEAYIANMQEVGSIGDLAKLSLSFTAAGALGEGEWKEINLTQTLDNRIISITRSSLYGMRMTVDNAPIETGGYVKYDEVHFNEPTKVKLSCSRSEIIAIITGTVIPPAMYIIDEDRVPMYLYPTATYPDTTIEGILPAGDYVIMRNKTDIMPLDIKAEKYE